MIIITWQYRLEVLQFLFTFLYAIKQEINVSSFYNL